MLSNKLMLSGIFLFLMMNFAIENMHLKLYVLEAIIPFIGVILFITGLVVKDRK
jgi:hypothetical protein